MAVVKSGRKTASGADIFMAAPSTPTQAVTRPTSGGGTITVTSSGKVTERTAEGKLVSQEKVSKEAASRVVEQEAQKIEAERVADVAAKAEAREQGALTPTRPEGLEIGSISQMTPTQTTGIIQRPELQATRTPLGTGGIVFTSGLGVQQIDTGVEPSMGIVGGAADLTTEPTGDVSIYQKLDRALGGYLPGGVKPKEAKLPVSPVTGIAYTYEALRPKLSSGLSKVAKVINPYSKEATIGQVKLRYERAQELERAGRLEEPKGFQALNPFKEESKIGRQIIKSVKAGQTFEEFRAEGRGQKGLDIAIYASEKFREKPLEIAEIGVVAVATGKGLATVGAGVSGIGGKALTSLGIKGRVAKFAAVDLPVYVAESKALGAITEKLVVSRGFTEKEAKTTAFVARVLQAEAFANIEGSKELTRIPISKTGKLGTRLKQAFKAKAIPGFTEGFVSTEATFDFIGQQRVFGVGVGGKKLLPSKEVITIPAIDTFKDKGFETDVVEIPRSEFEKLEPSLKERKIARDDLKDFRNKIFKITEGGEVVEEVKFGVTSPERKVEQVNIGRLATSTIGGTIGIVTAGTFGAFEEAFKKSPAGRATTTAIGYVSDPPELPGDVLTGAFTPFGGVKITTTAKVPTTTVAITQQIGDLSKIFDFGGEISRTKVRIKTPEATFTGVKELIKVEPPSPRPTTDFGFDRTTTRSPTSVKDIVGTRAKSRTITQVRDIVPVNIPTTTRVPSIVKTDVLQPAVTKTDLTVPSITDVDVPSVVNVREISNVSSFTQTTAATATTTSVDTITNVFTPRFFIPPPLPGGGGGSSVFFGRKKKGRKVSKYLPSLAAIELGIRGKKPLISSGLSVRPIPLDL